MFMKKKCFQICVSGSNDEVVWGAYNDIVYRWKGGHSWEEMDGKLDIVTCGQAGVFALNTEHKYVYYYLGTVGPDAVSM